MRQDITAHWDRYPHKWALAEPNPNIDHCRVPNLARFLTRHGQVLTAPAPAKTLPQWEPGDIVCWKTPGDHTGLGSDRCSPRGVPHVIHSLDRCAEEDVLTQSPIVRHYRYPAAREITAQ